MLRILDAWWKDLKHAVRSLLRSPGLAVVTVATLSLAIGANTAIFSVVDAVLLDPLGFPEADRLVSIRGSAPGSDLPEEFGVGAEFYVQYRENAAGLEDLALHQVVQTTMRAEGHVERLFVSPAERLPERFGGSPRYARIIEQHRPVVRSLEEELVGDLEGPLWILLGTVGIVLLIACANVANLLFVRAESRRGDLAIRRALLAARAGLVRTQMSEALLLAAGGGVGGVLLA